MIEHRVSLRKKIEDRRRQVEQALSQALSEGAPPERCNGLTTELQVVDNAVQGGWDSMAETTASDLMRWMERTAVLVAGVDASRAATPRPEA